jgi:GntR family transcriptional regulator, uxu operon transcriptional repressor
MKREPPAAAGNLAAFTRTLRDALMGGQWPAGTRLPTERSLADEYRLSRATVRKALSALKDEGLISQRVGSGTFASPAASVGLEIGPADLMHARLIFEPQIAELAVHNATALDFARMEECLATAEQATDIEDFEMWDGRLHEMLAESTHNAMVLRVFRLMSEARRGGDWGALKRRSATPERRQAYQHEHRALVQALRERDAPKAAALLRAHLVHVQTNLFSA